MDYWYCKNLGDPQLLVNTLSELQQQLAQAQAQPGSEWEGRAGVFFVHESVGRLHCELVVYFSPAWSVFAKRYGARPCLQPQRQDLSLLHGDRDVWSRLFD